MTRLSELTLEQLERKLEDDPKLLDAMRRDPAVASITRKCWQPQPGPQLDAYLSEADELLYGGAAGGGKTDLICGLSLTKHQRTLVFRRQSLDLDGIWERMLEVAKTRDLVSTANAVKRRIETTDSRVIEMGHLEKPGSEKAWQGRPHDLIAFDEAAQLDENKVAFVTRWLRTTTEGQRCRVIFATNPPIPDMRNGGLVDASTGDWLKEWFRPWLDPEQPAEKRAKSGELRWCYMRSIGDRHMTVWVDGPGWYVTDTGERFERDDPSDEEVKVRGLAKAKSRTFIQSLVQDNIYLKGSGYMERLSTTPEPLRSMLLHGMFGVRLEDHSMQVIPTNWVLAAQRRWRLRQQLVQDDPMVTHAPLRVLAADIAQGGADTTTIAPLHEDRFFDPLLEKPGRDTPDGKSVVKELLGLRTDKATIVLDCTGGWGGSTRDKLRDDHNIEPISCVASVRRGLGWTRDMQLTFENRRAEMWWQFREALDPEGDINIMLPPDDVLLTQLTAPHYGIRGNKIVVEEKEEIRKRLHSSTDRADAVIMAHFYLPTAIARAHDVDPVEAEYSDWSQETSPGIKEGRRRRDTVADIDPLADWDEDF